MRFSDLRLDDMRLAALGGAMAVYGALGTPTPDQPGLVEALVGALLVLAVGMPQAARALILRGDEAMWLSAGRVFLIFGLTFPVMTGILNGAGPGAMLRDVLPFLFMMLPVFMRNLFARRPSAIRYYLAGLVGLGLLQSARMAAQSLAAPALPLFILERLQEPHYLANSPAVLFAAMALSGFALLTLQRESGPRHILLALAALAAALIPVTAMALTLQRASLGVFALFTAVLCLRGVMRAPAKFGALAIALALLGWPLWPEAADLVTALIRKTALFGENMRLAEAQAAWQAISDRPLGLLIGTGWGGSFHSPAVGGERVFFTHSLLTSILLKTGLAGVFLTFGYLGGLAAHLIKARAIKTGLFYALAGPVLIDVFLYAAFKSLDFGLILLGLSLMLIEKPPLPSILRWPARKC